MATQPSLEGFELPARLEDRLFFALFPPPDVAQRIAERATGLRGAVSPKAKWLAADRFHVTLHHLGDHAGLRDDIVNSATEAAQKVTVSPFEVSFDRVMSFSRKGDRGAPFVMRGGAGLQSLMDFQHALGGAMKQVALHRWVAPSFTPHVTLAYDPQEAAEQAIEPIRWIVNEFALVHSLIGKTRHIVLGRWPLKATE
jgi:RNA 2',3'-cyclic 3'-phosphodiesterase